MWPFRPQRLSELFGDDALRALLLLGDAIGSAVKYVEPDDESGYRGIDGDASREVIHSDPFCTFFRHGKVDGKPAFAGADAACGRCEARLGGYLEEWTSKEEPCHRRCHMGLTDFIVPVLLDGSRVGAVVSGRVVTSDDERQRIRKIVARLGTQTRSEAASKRSDDVITPANEKARKRLAQEIAEIPVLDAAHSAATRRLASEIADFASRQLELYRRECEDPLLDRAGEWSRTAPTSLSDLGGQTSAVLTFLREEIGVEYLAFFARVPRELDDESACPSLVAESGLGTGTRRRFLEVDWTKIAVDQGAIAAAPIGVFRTTEHSPDGLKDRLTKSLYFVPLALRPGREAALVFGQAKSANPPSERDFAFFERLAVASARRYYGLALEVERRQLGGRLETREERLGALQETVTELRASEREARETRGFSNFDGSKLVRKCVERVGAAAEQHGVAIDARSLPDRMPMRAHRHLLASALESLLREALERTNAVDAGDSKSPVLVDLRRTPKWVRIKVEAIGDYLTRGGQRELEKPLRRGHADHRPSEKSRVRRGVAKEGSAEIDTGDGSKTSSGATGLDDAFKVARRHHGRFRIESERLRRSQQDPSRWLGKTKFVLDLPMTVIRSRDPADGSTDRRSKS